MEVKSSSHYQEEHYFVSIIQYFINHFNELYLCSFSF